MKIHLTNSDVDLRDPQQVRRLATVFQAAAEARMSIMIHMRTRAVDYGEQDVRTFMDEVLPSAGTTPVLIAHAGGRGGLDAVTWDAMETFASILEERPGAYANLGFDLAQVYDPETPAEDAGRLVALMRRIGIDRYVLGSDWPFSGSLADYFGPVFERLPLEADERARLRRSR